MKSIWKREMQGYFYTPLGYIYLIVFALSATFIFFAANLYPRSSDVSGYYAMLSTLWMLLTPLLVMRLIAGERRQMTDQLLLTAPMPVSRWVTGKFLAAVTVLFMAALLTCIHMLIVALWGQLFTMEYLTILLGFVLQGMAFTALDFMVSSLCRSPTTAFLLALGANLLVWLSDLLADAIAIPAIQSMLYRISLYDRLQPFLLGQLSVANLIYFVSFSVLCVVLSIQFVDARRWSEWI